ncbi:hypothetical protein K1T71_008400 [Dendrolimus kikuchii]|uniref:Uncharacterized protein n=1 Tax=Dendrolimus kikuchii TaxID=765133 RepID=A0ACC1CXB1_9NEOP|nr:hypothetical protein K1T71_008400 [Dendrolimus kikuchii]
MAARKGPIKRNRDSTDKSLEMPEVALAAIVSYKSEKDVGDFINFLLGAFERNCDWLNNIAGRQTSFRCALMVGAGPNRFQVEEIIYPSNDNGIKLEVEIKDSEDYDKVAIAALVRLTNLDMEHLMKYVKTRLFENPRLKEDLLKGKGLGISFAVLRPFTDKQYRVMERIVVGSSVKCVVPLKNRRKADDRLVTAPPIKRDGVLVCSMPNCVAGEPLIPFFQLGRTTRIRRGILAVA